LYFDGTKLLLKIETPEDVDMAISCEIPDPELQPSLHKKVVKYMLHDCGDGCRDKKTGKCMKGFPFKNREETVLNDGNGWVAMKRPKDGPSVLKGQNVYDTRDVVPYNPYLLERYDCHINVVPFMSLKQVKYVIKYMTKGVDKIKAEKIEKLFGHRVQVKWGVYPSIFTTTTVCCQNLDNPTLEDYAYAQMRVRRSRNQAGGDAGQSAGPPPGASESVPQTFSAEPATTAAGEQAGNEPEANADGPVRLEVLIDQIAELQEYQYMTASQAMWMILGFEMSYMMHSVSTY
jgi:hypothetical protein